MEPISAIVTALALGAAAAAKEIGGLAVKDAYTAPKDLIARRYPKVSVDILAQAPESRQRRGVVEENLQAAHAEADTELATLAKKLVVLIQQQAPSIPEAIGIDLKDVEAVNLRLNDIVASGPGVKVEKGRFSGDIAISGVPALASTAEGAAGAPDRHCSE